MANLTLEQANTKLSLAGSLSDVINILKEIDVSSSGYTTIFYSGNSNNEKIKLKQFMDNPNIRIIDKTVAAEFLNIDAEKGNIVLREALSRIFKKDNPNFNIEDDLELKNGSLVKDFLYRTNNGAWDTVSKRFAVETKGEVIAIIGKDAKVGRTFFQTEFEALKHNPNVTKINGVDKLSYILGLDIKDQHQLDKMKLESRAILLSGKNIGDITQKDMEAILKNKDFAESFKDIVSKYKPEELPKFYNHLNKIGTLGAILGAILGFSTATYKANEAYSNGNPELAKEIIGTYVSESAGGAVGGSALSTGTFMLLTTAGITVSAPAAIAIAVITSIAGGIAGSEIGSYIYKNRDIFSYFLNPFDENWKDRDQKWLEEIKNFWSPYLDSFGNDLSKTLHETKDFWSNFFGFTSIQIYDPLILDLNGNGKIDLTSTSNGVHFDHDANDISFKSSWVITAL